MNDSTLTQLKILVERAVRPVRASSGRKRKMREELLAHVSAVFEEETKLGDASAALERTAQRFGVPAELTCQLQSAAPKSELPIYWLDTLFSVAPRESALRHALRVASIVGAMCAVGLAIMIVVIGRWSEWLTLYRLPAILSPLFMAVLTFGAVLLARGMRQAMYGARGRSWPRVLAIGMASWLLMPIATWLWCSAFSGDMAASLVEIALLFLTGLLAPLSLLVVLWLADAELRYLEEWDSLPINGAKGATA